MRLVIGRRHQFAVIVAVAVAAAALWQPAAAELSLKALRQHIVSITGGLRPEQDKAVVDSCQQRYGLEGIELMRRSPDELVCKSQANGRCYAGLHRNMHQAWQVCELFNVTIQPGRYRQSGLLNAQCTLPPKPGGFGLCTSTTMSQAIDNPSPPAAGSKAAVSERLLLLVDRDGSTNLFHTMWDYVEAFRALYLLDRLDGNVDVLLVDNDANHQTVGLYGDIWSTLSKHPVRYWKNVPAEQQQLYRHVVYPTTGGCSLGWANRGEAGQCGQSALLRLFAQHTVERLSLQHVRPPGDHIAVLYISRQKNNEPKVQSRVGRKIANEKEMLDLLRCDPSVSVTAVDFVGVDFKEQLRLVRSAHILLGMHGAGMTHLIFMHDQAVVVELFPMHFEADHFHSLAQFAGKTYLSWHNEDQAAHFPDHGIEPGRGDKQATTRVATSGPNSVKHIFDAAVRVARSFGPHIDSRPLQCSG